MFIPRGTKVRKELEFFFWEGWVIGEFQTRGGTRMVAVEIDKEASNQAPSREAVIFCSPPDQLKVIDGVRILDKANAKNSKETTFVPSKY